MVTLQQDDAPQREDDAARGGGIHTGTALSLEEVSRTFGRQTVLDRVSIDIPPGEIHALLGPNGAGKTTLLRIASGLTGATDGGVWIYDRMLRGTGHGMIGMIPSGDRTFYLRISGFENLLFFARLYGLSRAAAAERARARLEAVGLEAASSKAVGAYSHGMLKRLAIARALLVEPPILLVDEATHDLDPDAAAHVRQLIRDRAAAGTAVLWTTQRVEEIVGFADVVTLLDEGRVAFAGSIPDLLARVPATSFVVELDAGEGRMVDIERAIDIDGIGRLEKVERSTTSHYRLTLQQDAVLGEAVVALHDLGLRVLACRETTPQVEAAFRAVVGRKS